MKVKKAVIPAAGLGTRILPATKAQPKEMLPVVDKPAIQYIVEEAVHAGIESILIVTGRNKTSIEDHFDKSFELEQSLEEKGKWELLNQVQKISGLANIHFVRQKEPLGLGHAVLCAEPFIGEEPFAVLLGDDIMVSDPPAIKQLMHVFDVCDQQVVGVKPVPREEVNKYGIVAPVEQQNGVFKVGNLVEKPAPESAPSQLAIMGRYVLKPSIFLVSANDHERSGERVSAHGRTATGLPPGRPACAGTAGDALRHQRQIRVYPGDDGDWTAERGTATATPGLFESAYAKRAWQ